VRAEYLFERTITLEGNRIRFDYRVDNTMARAFPMRVVGASALECLGDVTDRSAAIGNRGLLNWASEPRIRVNGQHPSGGRLFPPDVRRSTDYSNRAAEERPASRQNVLNACAREGYAGLYDGGAGQSILFEFETKRNSLCRTLVMLGGWPAAAGRSIIRSDWSHAPADPMR